MTKYYCNGCKQNITRSENVPSIRSYCETAGKTVTIIRVLTPPKTNLKQLEQNEQLNRRTKSRT